MSLIFEGRLSDSPYIEGVWSSRAGRDYAPICPANGRWNLLFLKQDGRVTVSVVGPLTKATLQTQDEGTEWLVITFKLGVFMPFLLVGKILDSVAILPEAAGSTFWLHGSTWQFPNYENVETFVDRLVRNNLLLFDPVVNAVLQGQPQEMSLRTVRRHFLYATGLTPKVIQQIERAQRATQLLERGSSLPDVAYQTGYADQAHMTRSLKHFIGQTPAQIARINQ